MEDSIFTAIRHIGIAVSLVIVFSYSNLASAQIAPTNTATVSGSVSDSAGKPIAAANVVLTGPKNVSTKTDVQGLFVFVGLPEGTYQLSVTSATAGTVTRSLSLQSDTNVAIQYELAGENGLKTIANVAASAHFNVTAASITQVNPMTNALEGKTTWRTILEQIPGISQGGNGTGSVPGSFIPGNPQAPVQISINGALPYETATLLDNMPLMINLGGAGGSGFASGAANLAFFPLSGFSGVDVVRGPGANAPSILNSVGGSLVLHSPGVVEQNHYAASFSNGTYGGIVANALAAMRWNKLSAVISYGVNNQPGPLKNAAAVTPQVGALGDPLTIDGQAFTPSTSRMSLFNTNFNSSAGLFPLYGEQVSILYCCADQRTIWTEHSGSIGLTYAVSPVTTAQLYYVGKTSSIPNNQPIQTVNFVPRPSYTGPIPPGSSSMEIAAGSILGAAPTLQASSTLEEKITTQVGRGSLRLAALQARGWWQTNENSPGKAQPLQLFGSGLLNGAPQDFNGETHIATFLPFSALENIDNYNRDLLVSYTTPLGENAHAGISFVKSYYSNPVNFIDTFGPFTLAETLFPSADTQSTNELRVFAGGNLSPKTSLDLSGYFVRGTFHTQDLLNNPSGTTYVDTNFTYAAPRLGFVWRPTTSVAVRAAAGGGFAEPLLEDFTGNPAIINFGNFFQQTIPNPNLQPEKSFGFDVGADVRLRDSTTLSLDLYRTNLFGQVFSFTSITPNFNGTAEPLNTIRSENLGVSRFEGILIEVRHSVPHGMYWTFSGGFTRGYIVSVPGGFYNFGGPCNPATGTNCTNVFVVPGPNFNGILGISIPYAQGLGILGYRWTPEKYVDLTATYYGNNNSYVQPAFVELDGHLSYPLTKTVSLFTTFQNVTGIYDGSITTQTPTSFAGVPTITGPPAALQQQPFGPRTVTVSLQFHM